MVTQLLVPFNFKKIAHQYLIVNLLGKYSLLNKEDFADLIGGKSNRSDLSGLFYINDEQSLGEITKEYKIRNTYLDAGTSLFIFVLTTRCNQNCVYCQAGSKDVSSQKHDMSKATAKKALDLILSFKHRQIVIEFQGGEPLLNFNVLKFIVDYSRKYSASKIDFNLVSNLLELGTEQLDYLIANKVSICTSMDGAENLHNKNRPMRNGNSFRMLQDKLALLKSYGVSVSAIQTTTKETLPCSKELIDQYISSGFDSIYLRTLNPFGLAKNNLKYIGYSPYEFLDFYKKALEYIIELNKTGINFKERTASIFLSKILSNLDAGFMDLRSPCGAAIGQMAINYNGTIYTCDEGRMLGESGDDSFAIGNVETSTFRELYDNDVTKLACLASFAECSPRC